MISEREDHRFEIRAISAGRANSESDAFIGYLRLPDNDQLLVHDGIGWVSSTSEVEAKEFENVVEVVECAIQELAKWTEKERWRLEQEARDKLRKQARSKIEQVLSEEEIEALGL